eukprot:scaffold88107_cov67-Phaeocystis_antarctica.AAC.2
MIWVSSALARRDPLPSAGSIVGNIGELSSLSCAGRRSRIRLGQPGQWSSSGRPLATAPCHQASPRKLP